VFEKFLSASRWSLVSRFLHNAVDKFRLLNDLSQQLRAAALPLPLLFRRKRRLDGIRRPDVSQYSAGKSYT